MRKLTWGKATSGQRSQVPWANKYLSTSSIKWHLQAQFTGCKKKKKRKNMVKEESKRCYEYLLASKLFSTQLLEDVHIIT